MTNDLSETQQEEFLVLQSIYPEYISYTPQTTSLQISVPVEFSKDTKATIFSPGVDDQPQENLVVSTLPPIAVSIKIPLGYPDTEPPSIDGIKVKASWLTTLQAEALETHLSTIWKPGNQVICDWIDNINCGQFLTDLKFLSPENMLSLQHPDPRILSLQLAIYNKRHKFQKFCSSSYNCPICLTSCRGAACLQLSGCNHVFCKPCLRSFWNLAIKEGNIARIGCPDPGCIKEKQEASVDEVRAVINPQHLDVSGSSKLGNGTVDSHDIEEGRKLVERWLVLREERDLAKDKFIVYCPVCQTGVRCPADLTKELSGWQRFRTCSACKFSFCKSCKRAWHGPSSGCQLTEEEIIRYIQTRDDNFDDKQPWMTAIDQEYGPENVQRQVDDYLPLYRERQKAMETGRDRARLRYELFSEEISQDGRHLIWNKTAKASEIFIRENTIPCPKCRIATEKIDGCNTVTCTFCDERFCWGCGQSLEWAPCGC